jgi:aryl-alcohol dehydrogenase-like predicted oxidoreductase
MRTTNTAPGAIGSRELGVGGPVVSELGLGCIGMTGFYGDANQDEAVRTLHRALDDGCTFFDTSDAYGPHTNEELLGRVLAGRRAEVFVATKFGITLNTETMQRTVDGTPETVRACCEGSLRRLGVDHIDLYLQHRVDPTTPIEDTVGAMAELVEQGKVRYLGLCEAGADTIRRAHTIHPLTAVQTEYSLWSRGIEGEVLATLRELGIGLIAYAPLSRGFLTGAYSGPQDLAPTDIRRFQPRFAPDNLDHNLQIVDHLRQLAADKHLTPAQLALAWVLHQGPDIVPIPGTTSVAHLQENLAATQVRLSAADLSEIDQHVPAPAGDRYDPAGMRGVDL